MIKEAYEAGYKYALEHAGRSAINVGHEEKHLNQDPANATPEDVENEEQRAHYNKAGASNQDREKTYGAPQDQ